MRALYWNNGNSEKNTPGGEGEQAKARGRNLTSELERRPVDEPLFFVNPS